MNKLLILLVGKAATGKTTAEKFLSYDNRFNRVISYTTRPQRENETNGFDYHFLTENEFNMIRSHLLEETSYNILGKQYYYGLPNELEINKINIAVVNVDGVKQILKKRNENTKIGILYLESPLVTRSVRYLNREKNNKNVYENFYKRLLKDEEDFKDFESFIRNERIPFINIYNEKISLEDFEKEILNNCITLAQSLKINYNENFENISQKEAIKIYNIIKEKIPRYMLEMEIEDKNLGIGDSINLSDLISEYGYNNIYLYDANGNEIASGYELSDFKPRLLNKEVEVTNIIRDEWPYTDIEVSLKEED